MFIDFSWARLKCVCRVCAHSHTKSPGQWRATVRHWLLWDREKGLINKTTKTEIFAVSLTALYFSLSVLLISWKKCARSCLRVCVRAVCDIPEIEIGYLPAEPYLLAIYLLLPISINSIDWRLLAGDWQREPEKREHEGDKERELRVCVCVCAGIY